MLLLFLQKLLILLLAPLHSSFCDHWSTAGTASWVFQSFLSWQDFRKFHLPENTFCQTFASQVTIINGLIDAFKYLRVALKLILASIHLTSIQWENTVDEGKKMEREIQIEIFQVKLSLAVCSELACFWQTLLLTHLRVIAE